MFTTNPWERVFGKLRQVSGGTSFINIQQVLENFRISKKKLFWDVTLTYPLFLHKMDNKTWEMRLFVIRGTMQGIW